MEVGVRELRNHLSRYLDRVRDGNELVVTDRGHAIARVVPVEGERVLDRLIAEGVVTPARRKEKQCAEADQGQVDGLGSRRRTTQVIAYFDSSAVVPLLIAEAGSERAASLWNRLRSRCERSIVLPREHARRSRRLSVSDASPLRTLRATVEQLDTLLAEMDIIEVDEALAASCWRSLRDLPAAGIRRRCT